MKNLFIFARLNSFMVENPEVKNNFALVYEAIDKKNKEIVKLNVKPKNFDSILDDSKTCTTRVIEMIEKLTVKDEKNVVIFTNKTVANTANFLYKISLIACGKKEKDEDGRETKRSVIVKQIAQMIGLSNSLKECETKKDRHSVLIDKIDTLYFMYIEYLNKLKEKEANDDDEEFIKFEPEITKDEVKKLLSYMFRGFRFLLLKKAKRETLEKTKDQSQSVKLYWNNVNIAKSWFEKQIKTVSEAFKDINAVNTELIISDEWEEV